MAYDFPTKRRSEDVKLFKNIHFYDMLLRDPVLDGLTKAGYKVPSPIQYEAIPLARCGNNLLVQAKSGTGKTLVFVITALEILCYELFEPQVLILVPAREIATQICSVIKTVSSSFPALTYEYFIGGFDVEADIIKAGNCQIVVGTPGRMKQLIGLKALSMTSIRLLVLDEIDELVKYKLEEDVEYIFNSLPEKKQVIATSATYPEVLKTKILKYLTHPFILCCDSRKLGLLGISHYAKIVKHSPIPLQQYRIKLAALEPILKTIKFLQCVVYCNGINKVDTLSRDIKNWGFSTAYISSKKQQEDRLEALDCLKHFKCKVLISSDVTARGMDVETVNLVINFDIPQNSQTYLHRSGRAGRYGTDGVTITLVNEFELRNLKIMENVIDFKSYELPDPVPVDLIDNPCLEKYAITVSEGDELEENESEKSSVVTAKDFTELKLNRFNNGDYAVQNDNVKKGRTSSKCLSATNTSDSNKTPEDTSIGISCSTNGSCENNNLGVKVKSQGCSLKNGKSSVKVSLKNVNSYKGITSQCSLEHSESKSERKNLNMAQTSSAKDVKSFRRKVPCNRGQESLSLENDKSSVKVSLKNVNSYKGLTSQCSPEHSKSERKNLNMTQTSSSAKDLESFQGKVSCNKGQESLLDSSSVQNFVHNRGKKGKKLKKRMYSVTERSNYLESKQQECHSSYESAYQHLHYPNQKVHYSSHVNAHQQLCHSSHVKVHQQPHCSHSNAYQQLHHSACSSVCPQPHFVSPQKSRFSNKHCQLQHSIIGSHCKCHVSIKKHDSVSRKTENLPCCGQHCAICFMPSVHRCHPYNDSNFCNQRAVYDQWYQMFYSQWLHIMRCCHYTY